MSRSRRYQPIGLPLNIRKIFQVQCFSRLFLPKCRYLIGHTHVHLKSRMGLYPCLVVMLYLLNAMSGHTSTSILAILQETPTLPYFYKKFYVSTL